MKSIELTEEHKSKLLEMCTKLFPEHKWSFRNDYEHVGMLDRDIYNNNFTRIHCFEFCMTHLQEKILKWGAEELGSEAIDGNIHLVDYLYEEFKKLKN